ncbi:hypothetical protein GGS20DRAFT_116005 [Poronia punctata]|nr:hypothetical protein GGS20DRAFT_116005 [Poronia punctata]
MLRGTYMWFVTERLGTSNSRDTDGSQMATLAARFWRLIVENAWRQPPVLSEADHLNAQNLSGIYPPTSSDVVVVGGGIHSLIYSIHARLKSQYDIEHDLAPPNQTKPVSITVLEKSLSPGYKIGESTLTTFGVWLKSIGISTALLWRLFGPKDGLAFYYLPHDGARDGYTDFCANGPAGDFVATLQIERKISELLLTLFAQRIGVQVLHGHTVDIDSTKLPSNTSDEPTPSGRVNVKSQKGTQNSIDTRLVVDATGRFRRFASKAAKSERMEGFNTDSFWAYFEMLGDEADMPLRHYESCHTNHICIAEGWAWIIRLPSWEGNEIEQLIPMVNYLLDLDAAGTAEDAYPSSHELARKFGLKFRWVTSIGYALRSDVSYPEDLAKYGSCEAERKFNWITSRYPRMSELMARHKLVPDLYGPGTTWFVRKSLTYNVPVAAGDGWAAIGDAAGFTNPLYSPGINCNMATSVTLAEKTGAYLAGPDAAARKEVLRNYNQYCVARVPNLHRMNVFNYLMMRSPKTGPLGPLWQYLCGTGNTEWQHIKQYATLKRVAELVTTWEWGSNRPEYIAFAKEAIALYNGPPTAPSDDLAQELLQLSEKRMKEVIGSGKYRGRWAGLLRYYDDDLKFNANKVGRDVLAKRCESCLNWRILTNAAKKCPTCGSENQAVAIERYN